MIDTGIHVLEKQGGSIGVSERELVRLAVQTLGLNEISEFNIDERIIEYKLRTPGKLVSMKLDEFSDELASDSPAPGGGSVAALNGSLSASLSAMVGNLTFSKKKYKDVKSDMIDASVRGQKLKAFFLDAIDKDTDAFNKIMDGFAMPKKTEEEKTIRDKAILEATKEATLVPFSVLEHLKEAAYIALITSEKGNQNSLSDAGVAGLTARAAAEGAFYNVMINLEDINDENFKNEIKNKAVKLNNEIISITDKVRDILYKRFGL
jgi:glutamate formiminotransferase/formiminotetrahydrofolate cyclodeaminase